MYYRNQYEKETFEFSKGVERSMKKHLLKIMKEKKLNTYLNLENRIFQFRYELIFDYEEVLSEIRKRKLKQL